MYTKLSLLLALNCAIASAQTTIDLGRQAKNIDFSNSVSTKTFRTGNALPPTCSSGETYLKLDAPAGQNIYACISVNLWAQQGGSDPVGMPAFTWNRTTAAQAQLSQGVFRFGSKATNISSSGSLSLQGSASGSIWIYAVASGSIVTAHNLGVGNLSVSGTGFVVDALGTGFPAGSIPLYECSVVGGVLPTSCTDLRTSLGSGTIAAGSSGALGVDCSSGSTCSVDVVPGVVPFTSAANTFTALNTFSHLKLPAGGVPNSQQCASASDAGRVWIQTTAASGQQVFVCEGVAGWRVQGAPTNISGASNLGYISTVPISTPLAAQSTVASANQIRLILIPVANQVRLARLAAWVATVAAGGKARLGVYKTDGTLLAQTGDLDTGVASTRGSAVTPVTLDPGYYYFAWSVSNASAQLAGSATGAMSGLFNHVSASPGQATCSQTMTVSGLPSQCTLVAGTDSSAFPAIAIAGFAQ